MTQESPETPAARPRLPEPYVPGNVWGNLGDRPHDALVRAVGGRPIVYFQTHHIPGHSPQGAWVAASAEVARQILLDTESFTSARTTSLSNLLGGNLDIVPIEADPPEHGKYRAVIADYFKPKSVNALAETVRSRADELLDEILPAGACDFVERFGKVLPASIFLDVYGLPQAEKAQFLQWSNTVMGSPSVDERVSAMRSIRAYLETEVAKRRREPKDDLLSSWANGKVDDRPATEAEIMGGVMLLFTAGLDTVAALMGWVFRHLAENPEDQRFLRENPDQISRSMDEFLRFFASVTVNRRATRDIEIAGAHICAGDTVTCSTTLASRDPAEFDNADSLDIRRGPRRHLAFGYGVHTCIGMHLARLELKTALERWLERAPPFRLLPGGDTPSHGGAVIALDALPLTWI